MALGSKVSVRKVKNHPQGYRWRATFIEGGKRRQKYFKTRAKADGFAEKREEEAQEQGTGTRLTQDERSAVVESRGELSEVGLNLRSAIQFAVKLSTTPQKWMELQAKRASVAALEASKRLKRMVKKAELSQERVQFNSNTMQNISRYETTIHRALLKDLHELQRIQAMRLGSMGAVPLAVDVSSDTS